MSAELLEQLNRFTRREHTEDEVYIFSVILCDNETDRDGERFSLKALEKMRELFVGKTGIFDHDAKSGNQNARIFSTELVTTEGRKTEAGEDYTCLRANAYMVRTSANEDLIREIDGGIKKEVSVSCMAEKRICSVCGADTKIKPCKHIAGRAYGGKKCHFILDGITDAYEWSFVAVPAQVNAGVTKRYGGAEEPSAEVCGGEVAESLYNELRSEIIRLAFLSGSGIDGKSLSAVMDRMSTDELVIMKKNFANKVPSSFGVQTRVQDDGANTSYKL